MHTESSSNDRQPGLWHTVVVPTAVGLEKFSGLLFPRHAAEGGPQGERSAKNRAIEANSAANEVPR